MVIISIDYNAIHKFTGKLNEILQLELKAGNEIVETYEGDWPYPNHLMIFLAMPFKTPIQRGISGVEFRNVNDPHYWKAEYYDAENRMLLCCRFDDPDFEQL